MSYPEIVWHWMQEVSKRFPALSWPQAKGLACYSLGIVLANTCGLTQVADSLAELLGQKRQSCFQRLREWRNEAKAKKGEQRQEVAVATCFAPSWRGFSRCGTRRTSNWCWCWMPPAWAIALWYSPSAWCYAVVPSRWPGTSNVPASKARTSRTGYAY